MSMSDRRTIPTLKIHPLLVFFIIISILTGTFVQLAIILLIVLLHELGHYLAALYYKWRLQTIILWVFGGVMQTDEYGSRPLKEEFVVTIAGPLQHLFIYFCAISLLKLNIFSDALIDLILYYNTIVLVFNLLPIWPLDGGKLFLLTNSLFFPFRQAYEYTIVFSMFMSVGLILAHILLFPFNLSSLLIIIFLLIENGKSWQHRYYIFVRFLLQRYENPSKIKRSTSIVVPFHMPLKQVFQKFYQGKNHLIYIVDETNEQTVVIHEHDCLKLYFDQKRFQQPIGELVT